MASRQGDLQSKSLGKKIRGIFSSKGASERPEPARPLVAGPNPRFPQSAQYGAHHHVPGLYFATPQPQQQWFAPTQPPGPGPYPPSLGPAPQANFPGYNSPYMAPPQQFAPPGFRQPSPLPGQFRGPPLQRVQTPNSQVPSPQRAPSAQGSAFSLPSRQLLPPGQPIVRGPSPLLRAHSPAVALGGPPGRQRVVILAHESDDDGDDVEPVVRQPGPLLPPGVIPVQTKDGIVFLRRVSDSDSERSLSPPLPPQVGSRVGDRGRQALDHDYDDYVPARPAVRLPAGANNESGPEGGIANGGSDANKEGVNCNRRYDFMPANMVPDWYIRDPDVAPADSPKYLCANCRHIDFLGLFRQEETDAMPKPRDFIVLGQLIAIFQASEQCGFCHLVMRIVSLEVTTDLPQHDFSEEEVLNLRREKLYALFPETFYLCLIRFKTEYNNPMLYLYSAHECEGSRGVSTVTGR